MIERRWHAQLPTAPGATAALALIVLVSGCSGSGSSTGTSAAIVSKPSARPSPRGAALAVSTANANAIQLQPAPSSCQAGSSGRFSLPDARCTPGATDPAVTQANIGQTICRDGCTETVRPPESVTGPEKEASLAAYGDGGALHDYEYDHLVPLELGGARNDPRNLWPEPGKSPNPKDELESALREMVCAAQLSLAAAQRTVASDWAVAYRRLVR